MVTTVNSQVFAKKSQLELKGNQAPAASIATSAKVDLIPLATKTAMVTKGIEVKTQSNKNLLSPAMNGTATAGSLVSATVVSDTRTGSTPSTRTRLNTNQAAALKDGILSTNPGGGTTRPRSSDFNNQLAAHRYAFLPTSAELTQMNAQSPRTWLTNQLLGGLSAADFGQNVVQYDVRLRQFYNFRSAYGGLTGERINILMSNYNADGVQFYRQQALTTKPFLHRYAEFFRNHFSVDFGTSDAERLGIAVQAHSYFAHTILPNIFGKFEDMVKAVSRFPAAMQQYSVPNSVSGPSPLQDWPREMMELHTVGVDAGYTQADVMVLARLWTGHKVLQADNEAPNADGRIGGRWYFNAPQHDNGAKSFPFLGIEMASYDRALGPQKLDEVLTALARHPATASRIADKLLFHFVGDDRSWPGFQASKARIAAVFTQTQGDLIAVARALLLDVNSLHPLPFKSPRPNDMMIGMIRAGGLVTQNGSPAETAMLQNMMTNTLTILNMPHMRGPDVRGYQVDSTRWVNEATIMTILDQISPLAVQISARMPAVNFYNNVIGALCSSSYMSSTSQQIAQFAASEPVNAIICTMMSPEVLMRRA